MHNFALSLPTLLILAPTAAGLIAMSMPTVRGGAITSMIAALVQAVLLVLGARVLDGHGSSHLNLVQHGAWFSQWHISYSVSLSAFSETLTALGVLIVFCSTMFTWYANRERGAVLQGLMWLTLAAITGLFLARDLVLFYTFFEFMLVPLLFAVGIWGGKLRMRATMTMFIYTFFGSLLMLVGVIAVGVKAQSFDLTTLSNYGLQHHYPWWAFAAFVLAFAVKAPLLPFQGWMPISYREAPIEVTAVLSGLVSKAAMVGFAVLVGPLFANYLVGAWGKAVIWAVVIGLLYGSIAAFRQKDARGVIAYSSLAQMSLIVLGLFVVYGPGGAQGMDGALLQAVNHGLISTALFLTIGVIEQRLGTSTLGDLGGLGVGRPKLYTLTLIVTMCALAVPGSNAFVGELSILAGAFNGPWVHAWIWGSLAACAIVLAAMYALRWFSAIFHTPGTEDRAFNAEVDEPYGGHEQPQSAASAKFGGDIGFREALAVVPVIAAMLFISAWPNLLHGAYHQIEPHVTVNAAAQGGAK